MKYCIGIAFFLVQSLNFANAQNRQLIEDIERYIAKVDSFVESGSWWCFLVVHADYDNGSSDKWLKFVFTDMPDSVFCVDNRYRMELARKYEEKGKGGFQVMFFRSDFSEICDRGFIVENSTRKTRMYHRLGELVAIKKEIDSLLAVLYVNSGRVIYYRGEDCHVKFIMQEHDLQF